MHHIDLSKISLEVGNHTEDGRGCVMWTGYVDPTGYGKRGHTWAHREALARKLARPIGPGMDACHTCDVRLCVNPDHLYEGTRRQNMADITARGRHNKPRGESHWRAKLSAADVAAMRAAAAAGRSQRDLGRQFGVHSATVSRIVRRIWRTEVPAA